jgi:glycosyltransferase involved in cell wall biosynthesis
MTRPLQIFDCADLSLADSNFLALEAINSRRIEWHRFAGVPKNALERSIRRPRLSRYRAALGCTIQAAARGDILISHLPLMSAALEATRLLGFRLPPHLAFAFNFTELPSGRRRRYLQRRFAKIDQFCVYSAYETGLYSTFFELPPSRFKATLWTQPPPQIRSRSIAGSPRPRPLVAAIGTEGRDFATMLAASRKLRSIDFLIVARSPELLADLPTNVEVKFGLPFDEVWDQARRAHAVLVPLLEESTCCGHITIVSAQQLGIPLIITRSHASREYIEGCEATSVVQPGDVEALACAIEQVVEQHEKFLAAADRDKSRAIVKYNRMLWDIYVANFILSHM